MSCRPAPNLPRRSAAARRRQTHRLSPVRRRAVVLIIVLVAVVVISLSAYTFSSLMVTHHEATMLTGQQLQARMLVQSGVEAVKLYLMQDEAARLDLGGHIENPLLFQGVTVIPDEAATARGSFTVVAPVLEATSGVGIRYGLEDESVRLNLNLLLVADQAVSGAGRSLLMGVPGMTEDVADAMLDWMDPDDEPREYGAELDYYSGLDPAYAPRNGPLTTVEELLLVRGVTPDLLFGMDRNRNMLADAAEASSMTTVATSSTSMVPQEGSASHRGWSAYLTLYSAEKNVNADGLPRINLNQDDMQQLYDELTEVFSEEWASFIVAYRIYGPYQGDQGGSEMAAIELDLSQSPRVQLTQVLDLIDARVQLGQAGGVRGRRGDEGGNQPPVYKSPFANDPAAMALYLPVLMDSCSVSDAVTIPGRININEAPPEVLVGIPGLTEEKVAEIMDSRALMGEDAGLFGHETWLMSSGLVTLEEMRQILPFVCVGGDVFRAQVVGYFQGGGPSARAEVVLDATEPQPRIVLWRDISHLGRGFALETLGVDLTGTF